MKVVCLFLILPILTLVHSQAESLDHTQVILRIDNGTYGPPVEEIHYYYDQWPIGLAISSTGRIFVDYTRGAYPYTLGEVINKTAEKPYPDLAMQVPPSSFQSLTNGVSFATNNSTGFISVQALTITPATSSRPETLWVLDTGRPTLSDGTQAYSSPGGPKLVAIDISNDTVYKTYTFPENVHRIDSYLNDVRIDLNPGITAEGQGVAYMADSSNEGRNGFIILDLGSGRSWRRLSLHPSTLTVPRVLDSYMGLPSYVVPPGAQQFTHLQTGLDGIQLSPTGETMFYSSLTSDILYSIPTSYLRDASDVAEERASHAVSNLGQRGGLANGFEGDSNGLIYQLVPSQNALFTYDPRKAQQFGFVRDPRILWPDSASIAEDGYIYWNVNQLNFAPSNHNGTDLRKKPGAILRAKCPGNGTKIVSGERGEGRISVE